MAVVRAPYPFALVCEVGLNNYTVEGFMSNVEARKVASKFWCCWVLFERSEDGTVEETAHGGVGFAHKSIREYADKMFKSQEKNEDVRAAAAAAAEARFAKSASSQPKKPTVLAAPVGGRDGKPDITNPAVWD